MQLPPSILDTLRDCSKDEAAFAQLVALFNRYTTEGEHRYRLLADHFPNGMVALLDHDLRFVVVNGQALAQAGLNPESLVGQRFSDTFPSEIVARDEPHIHAALAGETRTNEVTHLGATFTVRTLPVRDHERGIIGALVVTQDITERKRSEEQLRRNHDTFYNLIQNNPFGVYVIDADFKLRQVSLGSQKVFSNIRPLLGRDFAEILRLIWAEPFATEAIGRFQHTLATGEAYSSPSTVERRADIEQVEAYDWRIERITLPDGRYGVVCYFYDLTERQQWEQKLRESEDKRAMLLEQERLARQQAERAIAVQQHFLGMISHELRTPLTSIKGFSSTLLATDVMFEPDEQLDFIRIIDNEADRLTALISQLMDVVQMRAGRFRVEPAPTSVSSLLAGARPILLGLVTDHMLATNVPVDLPNVNADRQRVAQILMNLVSNAVKFAPTGSQINIWAERADDDCVQFSVSDDGPGIPKDEQKRVFEVFHQVIGNVKPNPGAGLGLAICKGLVEAHGGKIWIAERTRPGTTVSFTLPVAVAT